MDMNYGKLKGRIVEMYDTQMNFSKVMGKSYASINQRLNNKMEWSTCDIIKACALLDIPLSEAHVYFFTEKV